MSYLFASGQALLNQASDCYFSSNVFVRGVVTAVGLNLLYRSCEWIGNKAAEYLGIRLGPISHQARAIMGSWANVSVNPLLDRAAQYESGKAIDFYTRHVQRNARRYPRIEAFFRRCITNPIISSCLIGPVLEELAFRVAPNCLPPGLTRKIAV
ncbi:MAG: hypothetical protein KDK69_04055, partial [Chlamydiia bacterium]|nr:hypothetical protein [Chlamydiia bacterium]